MTAGLREAPCSEGDIGEITVYGRVLSRKTDVRQQNHRFSQL